MMHKPVNRIAVQLAVLLFFVVAVIGWTCGYEPATCAGRAAMAAAILYFMIRVAGKMVLRVLVGALVDDQLRKRQTGQQKG